MRSPLSFAIISWSGRAPRKTFWKYMGLFHLIFLASYILLGAYRGAKPFQTFQTPELIWTVLVYLGFVPVIGVMVRRLHDGDYGAWWLMPFLGCPILLHYAGKILRNLDANGTATLVGYAGSAFTIWGLIKMGFLRGTAGTNQYGQGPLAGPQASLERTALEYPAPILVPEVAGTPPKKRSKTKWAFASVGAVVLLLVVASSFETWLQVKAMSPEMRDRIVGCARAQHFAQATLKAPSTAEFASCSPPMFALRMAADEWIARGYFLEDASGAKMRSMYVVRMRHTTGSKDWSAIKVSIRAWPQIRPAAPKSEPLSAARNI